MNHRAQLSGYGGVEVLKVVEAPSDTSRDIGPDEVLVQVVAAGINPGEIAILYRLIHPRSTRPIATPGHIYAPTCEDPLTLRRTA